MGSANPSPEQPPLMGSHAKTEGGETDKSEKPQSFNPIEAAGSLSLLLEYEAILETVYTIIKKSSKYANHKLGIPFPFNVIVVLIVGFVVLYTA
jgi:hypothetical protein